MISFTTTKTDQELQQILALQKANRPENISAEELESQGFVSAEHNLDLLRRMHRHYPHIIAKVDDQVIGYALIMLRSFDNLIPILAGLFEEIDQASYEGKHLKDVQYFVMGQICIAKAYRGQGIFQGLYQKMKTEMSPHFDYIITSISSRNQRSLRAHYKLGFQDIRQYSSFGEDWMIVLWDWQDLKD